VDDLLLYIGEVMANIGRLALTYFALKNPGDG
jgi:hypothetical protein